ncbi:histidine--tRNA ligase [Bacteroidota bacterium]
MIQSIRGTKDLLPDSIAYWQFMEDVFRKVSGKFSYHEIRTPIFEKTEVFSRSIGETTDIVNKEMYTFIDKGGESVTLRPEGTANLVRSVIQNSLIQASSTLRLWYSGPFFRYERPQKGRLRQFHQYGAECIGSSYPESDAEIILLANDIISSTGIKEYKLLLNTLGSDGTREKFKSALVEYLQSSKNELSEDSKNRIETNPLRILDSKSERDKQILHNAPVILDFLDSESLEHFEKVKELLENSGIDIEITPQLVRGLDYYCHTVFEFQSSALGAQDSLGGGGRYDGLFEQLGFKQKVPAVGFAMGVERLLIALEQTNSLPDINTSPKVYIATTNPDLSKFLMDIASRLRNKGISTIYDLQKRSVKAQLRDANKLNCLFTIIIGEDELKQNKVTVKNMDTSEQTAVEIDLIDNFQF